MITEHHFQRLTQILGQSNPQNTYTLIRLAELLELTKRETEKLVETRLKDLPFLCINKGQGYYRPDCAEDLNHAIKSLHNRHQAMQLREETYIKKGRKDPKFYYDGKTFHARNSTPFQPELINI